MALSTRHLCFSGWFFLGGKGGVLFVLVCGDRVSLDSPDSIDQTDLKPRDLPTSAPRVPRLKVCTTTVCIFVRYMGVSVLFCDRGLIM